MKREKERVLRVLQQQLDDIQGQAETLDERRRELDSAIRVVSAIQDDEGHTRQDRREVQERVQEAICKSGLVTRAQLIEGLDEDTEVIDGALKQLTRLGRISRSGREYHAPQGTDGDTGRTDADPPDQPAQVIGKK